LGVYKYHRKFDDIKEEQKTREKYVTEMHLKQREEATALEI